MRTALALAEALDSALILVLVLVLVVVLDLDLMLGVAWYVLASAAVITIMIVGTMLGASNGY